MNASLRRRPKPKSCEHRRRLLPAVRWHAFLHIKYLATLIVTGLSVGLSILGTAIRIEHRFIRGSPARQQWSSLDDRHTGYPWYAIYASLSVELLPDHLSEKHLRCTPTPLF